MSTSGAWLYNLNEGTYQVSAPHSPLFYHNMADSQHSMPYFVLSCLFLTHGPRTANYATNTCLP